MSTTNASGLNVPEQTTRWEAYQQGELLKVRRVHNWVSQAAPPKRQVIRGFSRQSRIRLLQTISRIDWKKVGESVLVTLTYPDSVKDKTYAQRTQDRNLWLRYMEGFWGRDVATLWRIEWKERKSGDCQGQLAPHIHLIPFGVRFIPWQDVRKWWRSILKVKGPLSTDIRRTNSGEHTARYAAKYSAKEASVGSLDNESYLDMTGRAWNITRRKLIPWAPEHGVAALTPEQLERAMQIAGQLLGKEYLGGFFAMTAGAKVLFCQILGIPEKALDTVPALRR